MKFLYLFITIILIFISTVVNADVSGNELLIMNQSGGTVYIKLYPCSALYNSTGSSFPQVTKYSLYWHTYDTIPSSGAIRNGGGPRIKTILGLDGIEPRYWSTWTWLFWYFKWNNCEFSFDGSQSGGQDGLIGYGIYILEIYKWGDTSLVAICDPITIDWLDFNYGLSSYSGSADLFIHIRGDSSSSIKFEWNGVGGSAV